MKLATTQTRTSRTKQSNQKTPSAFQPRVHIARFHLDVSLIQVLNADARGSISSAQLGSGGFDVSTAGQLAADGRPLFTPDASASPSSLLSPVIISPGNCAVNRYFLPAPLWFFALHVKVGIEKQAKRKYNKACIVITRQRRGLYRPRFRPIPHQLSGRPARRRGFT